MPDLPIYPDRPETPGIALERRLTRLRDVPPASYLVASDELRRRAARESLLLTGVDAEDHDETLLATQVACVALVEAGGRDASEPSLAIISDVHARANPNEDGSYRAVEVRAQFENARSSPPAFIEAKLDNLRAWLSSETGRQMSPTERMTLWFARFLEIAPFVHGNFRTAHLFLSFFSASAGGPPIYLDHRESDALRQEVERAILFDTAPLVGRFSEALARSLDACETAIGVE